jgi:hypothetical protein
VLSDDELEVADDEAALLLLLDGAWWFVPGCAPRAAIAIPRKAIPAATPTDLRVVRSRRLASPMRDPLSMAEASRRGLKRP